MKKIVLTSILAVTTIVQFSSCSKKDKEPSLVGTWISKAVNNKIYISSVLTFDSSRSMVGEEIVITFNADKTFSGWSDSEWDKEYGTYSIDGETLVFTVNGDSDPLKYKLTKDELITVNEGYQEDDSTRLEIETITYKRK